MTTRHWEYELNPLKYLNNLFNAICYAESYALETSAGAFLRIYIPPLSHHPLPHPIRLTLSLNVQNREILSSHRCLSCLDIFFVLLPDILSRFQYELLPTHFSLIHLIRAVFFRSLMTSKFLFLSVVFTKHAIFCSLSFQTFMQSSISNFR